MTEAQTQGTSRDAQPAGQFSSSGQPVSFSSPSPLVPVDFEHPNEEPPGDEAEFDPSVPENPTLDQIEPELAEYVESHCEHCLHLSECSGTNNRLQGCLLEQPRGKCLQLDTTGITRQVGAGKMLFGELWKVQVTQKFSVAAKLREAGRLEEAEKLEDCHSRIIYAQCDNCGRVNLFRNRCDNFYCPECQPKLTKRRHAGINWWVSQVKQPKHVVLTLRNTANLNRGHVLELKKWFTRLRHRKFCSNWLGGFYGIEVTNESEGWHLHLHALVEARWIDAGRLAQVWNSVTGGFGKIVSVKDCRGESYLKEVSKYAAKGSDLAKWSGEKICEFLDAFTGLRTFGVFGNLYGKRTEFSEWLKSIRDLKPKCDCGCADLHYYSEAEWLEKDLQPTTHNPDRPAPPDSHPELFSPSDIFRGAHDSILVGK